MCTTHNKTLNFLVPQALLVIGHLKANLLFNFFFNHMNTIFLRIKIFVRGTAKITENIVAAII